MEAQNLFANSRVNITAEGKRYLGAVIGSTEYRDEYVKDLVKDWDSQPNIWSTIAETTHEAYSAFGSGFESKLSYFLRTIPNIRHVLLPLGRTIKNKFIPGITTGRHICNGMEKILISLPTRYGRLAIQIFHETAEIEFMNSSKITSEVTALIKKVYSTI